MHGESEKIPLLTRRDFQFWDYLAPSKKATRKLKNPSLDIGDDLNIIFYFNSFLKSSYC